jgi:elongation factor P hydroxylase
MISIEQEFTPFSRGKTQRQKSNAGAERAGENLWQLVEHINQEVLRAYSTVLRGGAEEPFYRAPRLEKKPDGTVQELPAVIEFRHDYLRSALHELAHWCIAGSQRRKQDDYGYWYEPDGRSCQQQQAFFQVEIKPQALEKTFCEALAVDFTVSIDNLGGEPPAAHDIQAFQDAIARQQQLWQENGLPPRAVLIHESLLAFQHKQRPENQSRKI